MSRREEAFPSLEGDNQVNLLVKKTCEYHLKRLVKAEFVKTMRGGSTLHSERTIYGNP